MIRFGDKERNVDAAMNSEQLQDWLTDLNERWKNSTEKRALKDVEYERTQLTRETCKTQYLINYLSCNYTDVDLVQPVVAQLLACYYRGGILRYFVLQCIPSLIHIYLLALAKRQKKSVSIFETFFLAIFNEEILAGGILSESVTKKVEEVRIPSIRFPSVYHDPKKLNLASDIALKSGAPAFVPDPSFTVFNLLCAIRNFKKPIVVHCSDGIF
ncbi:unnamed protein product, partial [Wuchereria bancrofti]